MLYRNWALALTLSAAIPSACLQADSSLKEGTPDIKHAGALAFAPHGILLVGDTLNAAVYAIDTGDSQSVAETKSVNIDKVNEKIAAMIGIGAEETAINDMTVNPLSGNLYLSVSRGKGPDATPLIFKADSKGNLSEVSLKKVKFSKAAFTNAPESKAGARNPRMSAITDIQFNQGKVIVAGLSNEEFASKLRLLNYPFDGSEQSTSIEVYHGAHGKLETNSPVRTFVTYDNAVLAAYTCTPLVNIPVDDLKGKKITGKTIAELGNMNNPLDMIVYKKGDQDYLLMANTARGVMKLKLSKKDINDVKAIDSKIATTAGLSYETIADLKGVVQLDKLNASHAVLLVTNAGAQDIRTIDLP
ncbi:MAG: hypothetical protein ABL921_11480 [Pirellula sp.]